MKIPVIVVDDDEVDRYLAKRQLAKNPNFGDVSEVADGREFLKLYADPASRLPDPPPAILVLMDVNMPGLDGFSTIAKFEEHVRQTYTDGSEPVVVMIFTSSDNPRDKARAAELNLVKGYLVKPLSESGIEKILGYFER